MRYWANGKSWLRRRKHRLGPVSHSRLSVASRRRYARGTNSQQGLVSAIGRESWGHEQPSTPSASGNRPAVPNSQCRSRLDCLHASGRLGKGFGTERLPLRRCFPIVRRPQEGSRKGLAVSVDRAIDLAGRLALLRPRPCGPQSHIRARKSCLPWPRGAGRTRYPRATGFLLRYPDSRRPTIPLGIVACNPGYPSVRSGGFRVSVCTAGWESGIGAHSPEVRTVRIVPIRDRTAIL